MAAQRPLEELASNDIIAQFRNDVARENGDQGASQGDPDREVRTRVDNYHLEVFHRTQAETTKRWTYEQEIKRPYYHVTELDEAQLANWRKYLDFEEAEGDYDRTKFLYERCLVTAANYQEFWHRYARWTMAQTEHSTEVRNEEVRNIYRRASCTYVLITNPGIRLYYARFEESLGKADTAIDIHESILDNYPGHLDTIVSMANTHRRQNGIDSAIELLEKKINTPGLSSEVKGALVAEHARLVWNGKGDADAARKVFEQSQQRLLGCKQFWVAFLHFEMEQPTTEQDEPDRYERVKGVHDDIRERSHLHPQTIKDLAPYYLSYLEQRGGKDAMAEWTELDKEVHGPFSVTSRIKVKAEPGGKDAASFKRTELENGQLDHIMTG